MLHMALPRTGSYFTYITHHFNLSRHAFIQVIVESLSEEEIAGLKEMFKMIDTDNSGHITLEELKKGLDRVGANLKDSEILGLMQAVRPISLLAFYYMIYRTTEAIK